MKKLKELLKKEEHIWFSILDSDKQSFLTYAKENGCKWLDGSEIQPETDNCGYHMGITKELKLGFVGMHCWFAKAENEPQKFKFESLVKGDIKIITSESVNCGHPDKTCDIIADAFLDEALRQDKESQMAVECAIKNDKLFVYGEATTKAKIDYDKIAKEVLKEIGYKNQFEIIKEISIQSPEINSAVVKRELCANDQGMCYGYATNETKEYMPLPIMVAHKIMQKYEEFRKQDKRFFADAKCQVSVEYVGNQVNAFDTILISVSHSESLTQKEVEKTIRKLVVLPVLEEYNIYVTDNIKYIVNPSGKFTIWGSFGDSGCVGRKIVVDTYGGVGRVGGGCFSSKNATKVDRSGAYYARYVAKNIVAYGFAEKCELQVAFAIGKAEPVSIYIDCFQTNRVALEEIQRFVSKNFDFRLSNIIQELDLLKPIYKETAYNGHFGKEKFPWEKIKIGLI